MLFCYGLLFHRFTQWPNWSYSKSSLNGEEERWKQFRQRTCLSCNLIDKQTRLVDRGY